jgi:hypothetical protein
VDHVVYDPAVYIIKKKEHPCLDGTGIVWKDEEEEDRDTIKTIDR